jgi:hypothetical protein
MEHEMQACQHHDRPRANCPDCPPVASNEDQLARTDSSFEPPLTLSIGRRTFKVWDLADASRTYQRERDASGKGASGFPDGRIGRGYRISYNGRVWNGSQLVQEATNPRDREGYVCNAAEKACQ